VQEVIFDMQGAACLVTGWNLGWAQGIISLKNK
jgi:hypothetical protein